MRVFRALREAIRLAQRGGPFRICHFSVQGNHIHLLVEATDRQALSRGVQGLAIRMARAVNRTLRRRGRVWADRYHRRDLATPREVRHALTYVLENARKHRPDFRGMDPCSSAVPAARGVVADARTWLLRVGWRRGAEARVGDGGPWYAWQGTALT